MKTTQLLATLLAATLPLTAVIAEDTAKTDTTDQKQEQSSGVMGKGQMMSNLKDQDAELDKLVAEMNKRARRQETRRYRGRFDQTGRTTKGAARADAEYDVGQRQGENG